jgi:hypothetical protein
MVDWLAGLEGFHFKLQKVFGSYNNRGRIASARSLFGADPLPA